MYLSRRNNVMDYVELIPIGDNPAETAAQRRAIAKRYLRKGETLDRACPFRTYTGSVGYGFNIWKEL